MTKRYIPKSEEIPSGLCECGCGLPTNIVKGQSLVKSRHFLGYPYPFRRGHSLNPYPPPAGKPFGKGPMHPDWKGGRYIEKRTGYVYVHVPNHPHAHKGYIEEHRIVMECALDRFLDQKEHVHHINGITGDNRRENLRVMPHGEHNALHFEGKRLQVFSEEHRHKLSEAAKRQWADPLKRPNRSK